ncbi:MAG: hypothetical protein M1838_006245 [Thelocarpon superellum]|nr:MAG: hypothetical protein M1838_006245 [Thelocarpon superellum]
MGLWRVALLVSALAACQVLGQFLSWPFELICFTLEFPPIDAFPPTMTQEQWAKYHRNLNLYCPLDEDGPGAECDRSGILKFMRPEPKKSEHVADYMVRYMKWHYHRNSRASTEYCENFCWCFDDSMEWNKQDFVTRLAVRTKLSLADERYNSAQLSKSELGMYDQIVCNGNSVGNGGPSGNADPSSATQLCTASDGIDARCHHGEPWFMPQNMSSGWIESMTDPRAAACASCRCGRTVADGKGGTTMEYSKLAGNFSDLRTLLLLIQQEKTQRPALPPPSTVPIAASSTSPSISSPAQQCDSTVSEGNCTTNDQCLGVGGEGGCRCARDIRTLSSTVGPLRDAVHMRTSYQGLHGACQPDVYLLSFPSAAASVPMSVGVKKLLAAVEGNEDQDRDEEEEGMVSPWLCPCEDEDDVWRGECCW